MELKEIYDGKTFVETGLAIHVPKISFDVFHPKSGDISKLFEELRVLKKYNPSLVSLTYGDSGSGARFSKEDMKTILGLELNLMPHFTCVCETKNAIERNIINIENLGIENILALRGDIPQGVNPCSLDFEHANDLVEFVHEKTTLSIGVAGYPEGHVESPSLDVDIENLKRKVDAGASAIFTQLFFENDKFYRYVEKVEKAGINLPIIAGIMPIRSSSQIQKMLEVTHVDIPQNLINELERFPQQSKKIGAEFAIHQCHNLIDNGIQALHFFTLNHSDQVSEVLDNIL